jgi:hypothetical protein
VLDVVGGQVVGEGKEVAQPGVGHGVEDAATLALGAHELAPAQACEVVGYPAARQSGPRDEFTDSARSGEELPEDGQAGWIGQHPEPARTHHCPGHLGLINVLGHDDDRRCRRGARSSAGVEPASGYGETAARSVRFERCDLTGFPDDLVRLVMGMDMVARHVAGA